MENYIIYIEYGNLNDYTIELNTTLDRVNEVCAIMCLNISKKLIAPIVDLSKFTFKILKIENISDLSSLYFTNDFEGLINKYKDNLIEVDEKPVWFE